MPAATMLTHDDLRRWRDCPRRFWLHRHADSSPGRSHATAHDQALRASYPDSILIEAPRTPDEWAQAITQTQHCLSEGYLAGPSSEGRALLGACLRSNDGAQVRIDVMTAGAHGLRIFKLRYATMGDDADVDDVALWAHVAARCGLRLQSVGLLLIDTDFIYPGHGCYAGLLREADLSPVLGARTPAAWLVAMQACAQGLLPDASPDASCTRHGGCEHAAHCGTPTMRAKAHDPASLEIVGRELAQELRHEGHTDLMTVPESRLPDARRRRALRAVKSGRPELDASVAPMMQALAYPRHTLRFDTIGFATPIWPGTRPYQVLPFQWTCDVEAAPGELKHLSFLVDQGGDPRRAFAESLLQAVGFNGPILAYNAGFERNRIRELAMLFEDLATDLEVVSTRIVDLFQIARAHYYHPAMCGSWSFKSLCRAVAPELHADRFEWGDDTEPQVAFARTQQERLDAHSLQSCREALQAHGRRQTAVLRRMVALFEGASTRAGA